MSTQRGWDDFGRDFPQLGKPYGTSSPADDPTQDELYIPPGGAPPAATSSRGLAPLADLGAGSRTSGDPQLDAMLDSTRRHTGDSKDFNELRRRQAADDVTADPLYIPPGVKPPAAPAQESLLSKVGHAAKESVFDPLGEFVGKPKEAVDIAASMALGKLDPYNKLGVTAGNEAGQLVEKGMKAGESALLGPFDYLREQALAAADAGGLPQARKANDVLAAAGDAVQSKAASMGTDPAMLLIPESKAIGAAFLPGMAEGVYQGGKAALDEYRQHGITPEFARQAGGAAVDAAMLGLTATHAMPEGRAARDARIARDGGLASTAPLTDPAELARTPTPEDVQAREDALLARAQPDFLAQQFAHEPGASVADAVARPAQPADDWTGLMDPASLDDQMSRAADVQQAEALAQQGLPSQRWEAQKAAAEQQRAAQEQNTREQFDAAAATQSAKVDRMRSLLAPALDDLSRRRIVRPGEAQPGGPLDLSAATGETRRPIEVPEPAPEERIASAVRQATSRPAGAPRLSTEPLNIDPSDLRPMEDVVNENVSRRMRQQGAADNAMLARVEADRSELRARGLTVPEMGTTGTQEPAGATSADRGEDRTAAPARVSEATGGPEGAELDRRGVEERRQSGSPVDEDRRLAGRRAVQQEFPGTPDHVADALAQARHEADTVRSESRIDRQTGVLNRDAYHSDVATKPEPAGVSEFDLRGVGAINNRFGEPLSDSRIAAAGAAIKDAVGEHGTVYRKGGDEFAIHWNDHATGERQHAEVARALENAEIVHHDADGNLATSWKGIEHYDGFGRRFKDASDQVYAAKPKEGDVGYKQLPPGLAERIAAGRVEPEASGRGHSDRVSAREPGLRAGEGQPSGAREGTSRQEADQGVVGRDDIEEHARRATSRAESEASRAARYTAAIRDHAAPMGAHHVVDFEGDLAPGQADAIAQRGAPLAKTMGSVFNRIRERLKTAGLGPGGDFSGFALTGKLHGAWVGGKVYINPLAAIEGALSDVGSRSGGLSRDAWHEKVSQRTAGRIVDTMLHEYAHHAIKGHGPEFDTHVDWMKQAIRSEYGAMVDAVAKRLQADGGQLRTLLAEQWSKADPHWTRAEEEGRYGQDQEHGRGPRVSADDGRADSRGPANLGDRTGRGSAAAPGGAERGLRPARAVRGGDGESSPALAASPRVRGSSSRVDLAKRSWVDKLTPEERARVAAMDVNDEPQIPDRPEGEYPGKARREADNEAWKKANGVDLSERRQPERADTFYSALERAAEQKLPEKGAHSPAQVLATLKKTQGVKPDELKWSGLDAFLEERGKAGKGVTRQEVLDHLKANNVRVEEVVKGEVPAVSKRTRAKIEKELRAASPDGKLTDDDHDLIDRALTGDDEAAGTLIGAGVDEDYFPEDAKDRPKFGDYTLPGGKNYRELLLTLPEKDVAPEAPETSGWRVVTTRSNEHTGQRDISIRDEAGHEVSQRSGYRGTDADAIKHAADATAEANAASTKRSQRFQSQHFNESNVLAHVRFNERTDAEGRRVLHIEEVQSDWAQKGRQDGFDNEAAFQKLLKERDAAPDDSPQQDALQRRIDEMGRGGKGVPSAPFVGKTEAWTGLAMKRMVRWAAENGFDRITWADGDTQAARYDLSKKVGALVWETRPDGKVRVVGYDHDGDPTIGPKDSTRASLPDLVGKEMAERMKEPAGSLEGDELRMGGEGMRAFYDRILPNVANDLGKRFGARVGETKLATGDMSRFDLVEAGSGWRVVDKTLNEGKGTFVGPMFRSGSAAEAWLKDKGYTDQTVHSLDITPAMKSSVMTEGQPLFSQRTSGNAPTARAAHASGQAGTFDLPEETIADKIARKFQDQTRRIETVEKAVKAQGGTGRDVHDAFAGVRSKTSYQQEKVLRDYIEPLTERMGKEKVPLPDLDDYMTLLHKPTRDAVIAEHSEGKNTEGSGWNAKDAAARWAELEQRYGARGRDGKMAELEPLANTVREMREHALNVAVDGGLLSKEQVASIKDTWGEDYVPQRSFEVEGIDALAGAGSGSSGFVVKGKEYKGAHGRESHADSPVSFTVNQVLRTIARAEKNKADQTFGKWVEENKLFPIDAKHVSHGFDAEGKSTTRPDQLRAQQDFAYKVNGTPRRIDIASVDPLMDRALRNMAAKEMDGFVGHVAALTRRFSQMVTSYTPSFVFRNLTRDVQAALINVSAEQGGKVAGKVLKGIPKALAAMYRHSKNPHATDPTTQMVREFREDGGAVGWSQVKSAPELERYLTKKITTAGPGLTNQAKQVFSRMVGGIESLNASVENGTRFAVYKALREAGADRRKAGSAARNVTLDFTKKGEASTPLNAAYAFFNANIQGAKRLKEVAVDNPKGRAIAGGVIALGAAMDAYNRTQAGDADKDGLNDYDAIPEFVKQKNLILMRGEGEKPLMFPMPYGFNLFHTAGRQVLSAATGAVTPARAAFNVAGSLYNAFNPLGGEAGFVQTITPTVLDPFVQHATNETWSGRPLEPEAYPGEAKPESERYFKNVSPLAKAVAQFLNEKTGGDKVTPGYISVSPEVLAHYADAANSYLTGGMGKEALQVGEIATTLAKGETPELRNIPVAKSFVYEESPGATGQRYRDNLNELDQVHERYSYYTKARDREAIRSLPQGLLHVKASVDAIDRQVKAMRRAATARPELEPRIRELQARANKLVSRAREASA